MTTKITIEPPTYVDAEIQEFDFNSSDNLWEIGARHLVKGGTSHWAYVWSHRSIMVTEKAKEKD